MTETTLIIAAVLFVFALVLCYAAIVIVKNIIDAIAFTARSKKRNRRVLEQVRSGEYPDYREYKPVDGYGYPSPTASVSQKTSKAPRTHANGAESMEK